MNASRLAFTMFLSLMLPASLAQAASPGFSFRPYLRRAPSLSLGMPEVTGLSVRVNGADSRHPSIPFLFDWGDGTITQSFFPAEHRYARPGMYLLRVTARYEDGTSASEWAQANVEILPDWKFDRLPEIPRRVLLPAEPTRLTVPPGWGEPDALYFSDAELHGIPRQAVEYILDVAHFIGMDLCNQSVRANAARKQLVLKNKGRFGASLWYTDPSSMAMHPLYFQETVDFSSLFHELGHNLTLNSPRDFHFGGKTDGPMNAIVSETLAQVFQHAIAYEILNRPDHYGIPAAALPMIRASAVSSAGVVRDAFFRFTNQGCRYTTYNDPTTERDEAFDTFMTVAYTFMDMAERVGDYRQSTKRMMRLLQSFCEKDRQRFQERDNEPFRATFLASAVSYAFDRDLRERFRKLRFPINDDVYRELMARVGK